MTPRTITLTLDVGDAAPDSCGQCPFRVLDWAGGEPRGDEFCTAPDAHWTDGAMLEVTGGVRHEACLRAERRASETRRIEALLSAWREGDEAEGAPSARRTLLAIEAVIGV